MDVSPVGGVGPIRPWRTIGAVPLTLVLAVTITVAPTAAAASTACLAVNVDTGFTAGTLRDVVKAAGPGHHLTVQGICVGTTYVTQSLTITGVRTATSGAPVLQGNGKGRVLKVQPDITVLITDLTIRGGNAGKGGEGGGIHNEGNLTLRDVIVTKNRAGFGGGISSWGVTRPTLAGTTRWVPIRLVLAGKTRISGNIARRGGGVQNLATLVMTDSSRISGNRADWGGGGVANGGGTIVMRDDSRISGNSVSLDVDAPVGGGIENAPGSSLKGVICAPKRGANVFGNDPDDCRTMRTIS